MKEMVKSKSVISEDYVIARKGEDTFTVTKFVDKGIPFNVYNVIYKPKTGYGKCDCPAAVYRQTGSADKHVLMVKTWLDRQQDATTIVDLTKG